MCAGCNNDRTSTADSAYDALATFIDANQNMILATHKIDLGAVYGLDWQQESLSMTRYFAKHIGPRLFEAHIAVRGC